MSTIAVTGATGQIGSALVHHLLKAGHRVVAISRPSAKLDALKTAGADVRPVDVATDATGLTAALRDADAAFLLVPPNVAHPDVLTFADGVSANFEQAIKAAGIRRVVQLSSLGADRESGTGPIVYLHRLEKRLEGIANLDLLVLRPTYFFENLYSSIGMIKGMGINGGAQEATAKIPMIATADIAAYAAQRLNALDWHGTEVQELLGDRDYSMQEATQLLGQAIGKPELPYVQFPYADAEQGMIGAGLSPSMAGLYIEMAQSVNESALFRNVPRDARATTPTSLEDWAAQAYAPVFKG